MHPNLDDQFRVDFYHNYIGRLGEVILLKFERLPSL